jgi:inner membrane protein
VRLLLIIFFALCCISLFVFKAKHRRETHCGLLMVALFLPNIYIVRFTQASSLTNSLLSVWLGFCLGWFSHLVADTFNRKGVPWFYPFSRRYFRFARITTGGKGESDFRTFCIAFFISVYVTIIIFRLNIASIFS